MKDSGIHALGMLGDRRAHTPLLAIFDDNGEPPLVRQSAAYALGNLGDKRAV